MKKKIRFLLIALIVILAAAAVTAQASGFFDFSSRQKKTVTISQEEYDRLQRFSKMDTILQYVEAWYWQDPDVDALIENATRGLLYGLEDPYTFYYNEAEWAELWSDDEGDYVGVGLELLGNAEDYTVTITQAFRDAPAERAGIRKGDILVRVGEIEVNFYSMQNAVNLMRSSADEPVEIEVLRGEEYLTFLLQAEPVHINRVEYTMLDDQVGYIHLYQFAGESDEEVSAALRTLKSQGATALVMDLRDNGGGWVDHAIGIADLFLDEQVLVYSQDRYGDKDEYKTKNGKDDIPLVFLVNGNSASASEILSGGLQDVGRAKVVGTLTYGKGIIQTVISLDGDKDGFQMTYAQYFLPSGTAVHKVGITPDVISEIPEELAKKTFDLGDMSDPQLIDAWNTVKEMRGY